MRIQLSAGSSRDPVDAAVTSITRVPWDRAGYEVASPLVASGRCRTVKNARSTVTGAQRESSCRDNSHLLSASARARARVCMCVRGEDGRGCSRVQLCSKRETRNNDKSTM